LRPAAASFRANYFFRQHSRLKADTRQSAVTSSEFTTAPVTLYGKTSSDDFVNGTKKLA